MHSTKLAHSTLTNSMVSNSGLRQATRELVVIPMWILEVTGLLGGRGGQAPGRKGVQYRHIQILWTSLRFSLQPIPKKLCFRSFREHWKLALSKTRVCLDAYLSARSSLLGAITPLFGASRTLSSPCRQYRSFWRRHWNPLPGFSTLDP